MEKRMESYIEIISDVKPIMNTIQSIIDARVMGKIEIPDTEHSWITMILEIKKIENSFLLSIEKAEGFESILPNYPNREVSLEFMGKGGVPCRCRTKIVECRPNDILLELPREILRIQRRKYLRINAIAGTEITFRIGSSGQKRGEVKDFSPGGIAFVIEVTFLIEKDLKFGIGDLLNDIFLKIPEGKDWLIFQIPKALVRRVEHPSLPERRTLCAVEFLEMSNETREKLIAYISKQQMAMTQKRKG